MVCQKTHPYGRRDNISDTGTVANCCRQIDYDMKHGVTHEQVLSLLNKLRHHASYSDIREVDGFLERLNEIEKHFSPQKEKINIWH